MDYLGSQDKIDNIKYELVSIINGGLILYPASFYIFGINQKWAEPYTIGIYFILSFITSKLIDSICAPFEGFIDSIQLYKLEREANISHPQLSKHSAKEKFCDNWNTYLTLQFNKTTLPIGQKYLANLVTYFKIQMNTTLSFILIWFQLIFMVPSIKTDCIYIATVLLTLLPVCIGVFIHIKFSITKIALVLVSLVFFTPILFNIHGQTPFNTINFYNYNLMVIESYSILLSALIFSIFFLISLRSSWALFKIREILIKEKPNPKYINNDK